MKRERLKEGMKCKVLNTIPDFDGALFEDDVVTVLEWSIISEKKDAAVVVVVQDDVGRHHTIGLGDISPL